MEKKDEDTKEKSDSTSEEEKKEETPEEKSEGDSKQDIDYYKTELEKKQRELEQAKHVLASKRYEKSQNEQEEEKKETEEEADERTRRIIREENQRFALVQEKERIDELVSGMSRNEDEKKLILHHLEHSVASTGSLKERVENAYFIANKGLISKQLEELGKAAFSKQNRSASGGETGQRKEKKTQKWDELSEADRRFLQRSGLTQWDETKQRWIKPSK